MVISCGCQGMASCQWVWQLVSGLASTASEALPSGPDFSSLSTLVTLSVIFFVSALCSCAADGILFVEAASSANVETIAKEVTTRRTEMIFFISFRLWDYLFIGFGKRHLS